MAAKNLSEALREHRLIALDSCALIYHLERHETFGPAAEEVLSRIQGGRVQAVLSTLALLEVQVGPYRRGDEELADYYYGALRQFPNVRWVPMTYEIADRAAQLRAAHKLKTPDAIHIATAIASSATLLVTNDRSLPAVPELSYMMLDEV